MRAFVAGIEERTLRRLPDQIKALADKIQRVNESPYLNPNRVRDVASQSSHPEKLPKPIDAAATDEYADLAKSFFCCPRASVFMRNISRFSRFVPSDWKLQ